MCGGGGGGGGEVIPSHCHSLPLVCAPHTRGSEWECERMMVVVVVTTVTGELSSRAIV